MDNTPSEKTDCSTCWKEKSWLFLKRLVKRLWRFIPMGFLLSFPFLTAIAFRWISCTSVTCEASITDANFSSVYFYALLFIGIALTLWAFMPIIISLEGKIQSISVAGNTAHLVSPSDKVDRNEIKGIFPPLEGEALHSAKINAHFFWLSMDIRDARYLASLPDRKLDLEKHLKQVAWHYKRAKFPSQFKDTEKRLVKLFSEVQSIPLSDWVTKPEIRDTFAKEIWDLTWTIAALIDDWAGGDEWMKIAGTPDTDTARAPIDWSPPKQ
jgi:hypothetical protein